MLRQQQQPPGLLQLPQAALTLRQQQRTGVMQQSSSKGTSAGTGQTRLRSTCCSQTRQQTRPMTPDGKYTLMASGSWAITRTRRQNSVQH